MGTNFGELSFNIVEGNHKNYLSDEMSNILDVCPIYWMYVQYTGCMSNILDVSRAAYQPICPITIGQVGLGSGDCEFSLRLTIIRSVMSSLHRCGQYVMHANTIITTHNLYIYL